MNTGKNIFLLGLVFSLCCFMSCNDEKENGGGKQEGETAYLSIRFSQPKTYAADPVNAMEKEVALNTVDIYIYNDMNGMQNYVSLTQDDFDHLGDNVWQLKETSLITSTEGVKSIYAGVNLPAAYRNVFSSAANNPEQAMATLTTLNEDANGFAMFSRAKQDVTLVGGQTTSITIPVERHLAKVAVFNAVENYTLANAGTFSGLSYDIYNNNTRFYLLRNTDNYIDPNYTQSGWSGGQYSDHLITGSGFIPVEADPGVYTDYTNVKYTLENSTEVYSNNSYSKLVGTATYAVVGSVFQPATVTVSDDGMNFTTGQTNTYPAGTTFLRVTYSTGETEYVVGADRDQVRRYARQKAGSSASVRVEEYRGGNNYFAVFLDESNNHDVRRNHFYKIYINGFGGLGSPNYPGEPGDPYEPGVDPGTDPGPGPGPGPGPEPEPEPDPTYNLQITVLVEDWYGISDSITIENDNLQ